LDELDIIIISTLLADADGLRLATQLKSLENLRHVPIIMLVDEEDTQTMLKGLELGINDYLRTPVDQNEMAARVKTQIRRKKYQDALKQNYQASVSMAITDQLTGLYNRHYLDAHLHNLISEAKQNQKPLSLLMMDMDHFKPVNDTYGHDVGDEVLIQLAQHFINSIRSSDLAARIGGEEFVVLLPKTSEQEAAAERIRSRVEKMTHPEIDGPVTVSIGAAAEVPLLRYLMKLAS
jgi:two-component system cell cycle response regulator